MTEEQLGNVANIRNAIDDLWSKLENAELYEKVKAAKVSYKRVKAEKLVTDNLEYIVEKLNALREDGEY